MSSIFAIYCPPVLTVGLGRILLVNGLLLALYMSLAWLIARLRNRLDTVDVAWGLGFVIIAWTVELLRPSHRSLLIAVLVSIWGLRLAGHIYLRGRKKTSDPRYEELTKTWSSKYIWERAYVSLFLFQGALVWLVSLPVVFASNRLVSDASWFSLVGAILWAVGFIIEAVSDRQLKRFLAQKDHPKVLSSGWWHYSRHPNYFGELLQWWSIGIIALQASYGWIGLAGPLVLTILIVFVSGLPPIERRRAKDPAYRAYRQRTSPLIPLPPKKH